MEDSMLHDLLSHKLYTYREELEAEENNFSRWVRESREELEKSLNSEQLKLVDRYKHRLALREEDIELQVEMRLMNLAVKIGMQLQQAFINEMKYE